MSHPTRPRMLAAALLAVFCTAAPAVAARVARPPAVAPVSAAAPAFGAGYASHQRAPTLEPGRAAITLYVTYGGGCGRHTLTPQYRATAGGVELWVHHASTPDSCEALISQSVRVSLPASVRAAAHLDVLAPGGRRVRIW